MIKCKKCDTEVPVMDARTEKGIKWGGMLFSFLALVAIMWMFGYMYFNAEKIYDTPLVKAPCVICEEQQGFTCLKIDGGEFCSGDTCTVIPGLGELGKLPK